MTHKYYSVFDYLSIPCMQAVLLPNVTSFPSCWGKSTSRHVDQYPPDLLMLLNHINIPIPPHLQVYNTPVQCQESNMSDDV